MRDSISIPIYLLSVCGVLLLLISLPIVFVIMMLDNVPESCGVDQITSKLSPNLMKSLVVEEKHCDAGFGLNEQFIDIVLKAAGDTSTDPSHEEQLLRVTIPVPPAVVTARWYGNSIVAIDLPPQPLKREFRSWFPSVRVVVR